MLNLNIMATITENNDTISTQDKILQSAEKEFIDKGYAGARTTSIAAAAGVTHAMLHYYFRTKEKLFQHILAEKVKYLKGMMLSNLLHSDKPLLEKVKSAVETHLDFLAYNPDLPRFMLTVLSGYPEFASFFKEKVHEDRRDIIRIFQDEIDRNATLGLCKKTDARMLLLDLISLNVFSFVGAPLINNVLGKFTLDKDFIEERKKNNVEMIMQKLKP